ncbi:MAG: DUF1295 domain-containing protein [Candidatus Woesearchaeota archaeon]
MVLNQILLSFFFVFLMQMFGFFLGFFFKTDKFTDLFYGLCFAFLALFLLFYNKMFLFLHFVLVLMIFLWGFRLSGYLFYRILKTKKDNRFDEIRNNFFKFLGFWILQATAIFLIMLPSIVFLSSEIKNITLYNIVGFIIWLIGFLIETIADFQKDAFKKKHKDKFINVGLWKYSRHPNYFGEILVWIGVFIFTIPVLKGIVWLTIISPIFITFLLLFVSGIPILEKNADEKYGHLKEYQEYKRKTCLLILWFNKK